MSMAAHGARRLAPMARQRAAVVAIEALAAAQGCDFHAPLVSSPPLESVRARSARETPRARRRPLLPRRSRRGGAARAVRRDRRRGGRDSLARSRRSDAMNPAWLTVERRDAPLIVSVPHAGTELIAREPPFVSAWLARQRRRLACAGALRLRRRARRDDRAHRAVALADRCQSRPQRRLALSRPGDHRALPDHHVRRRAALSRRRGARRSRDRRAPAALLRALSRRAEAARSPACAARHPRVVLYDAHSIRSRIPRLFDGELPRLQSWNEFGRELRPRAARARRRDPRARAARADVVDGRFTGGWITRDYGASAGGRPRVADGARLPRLYDEPMALDGRTGRASTRRRHPRDAAARDAMLNGRADPIRWPTLYRRSGNA